MDLMLGGRTMVISGATRGIGRAIAERLAAEGAGIVVSSRSDADVEATVTALRAAGARAEGVAVDVVAEGGADRLIETALAAFGRVDGIVANAGGAIGQPRFADTTAEDWLETYRWNVVHAVELLRAARPALALAQGSAVLIGSLSAALPSPWPQYAAAKAALESVARSLAGELAPERIRVNCVRPGSIFFEGGAWSGYASAEPQAFEAFLEADLPWGRLGAPGHIANVVAFLLSPVSEWINGAVVPVDSGQRRSSPYPTTQSH